MGYLLRSIYHGLYRKKIKNVSLSIDLFVDAFTDAQNLILHMWNLYF